MLTDPGYLVFGAPVITDDDIDAVVDTLRSGWIGTGPRVQEFEHRFSDYVGLRAVAVSSCTAALHLALVAAGIGPGDEVIVPAMTFVSTANAVVQTGARPVLADVDRDTMCLTGDEFWRRTTSRTMAVIPVHFAGRACDMIAITAVAGRWCVVIEDCAHAIETTIGGQHAGTFGQYGAFSFYVTKNVTTGEGGMVISHDPNRMRRLALHGMTADAWRRFTDDRPKHYDVAEAGFKYNMTDLQAALGLGQLARVETNLLRREEIWARYDDELADVVQTPAPVDPGTRHARHLYTVMVDDRDQVRLELHRRGIGTGVHYRAVHLHPFYRNTFGYRRGDFPNAEWISDRTLSLPLSPGMVDSDVDAVISAVKEAVRVAV